MFNKQSPTKLHLDINSCFATLEQQANPLYRYKPLVVAASRKEFGCVLAASIEAKKYGIRTGMLVQKAYELVPGLIVKEPDPNKYRDVHKRIHKLLSSYTDSCFPKSIDEFVLDLYGSSKMKMGMTEVGKEIKRRIKSEVGEWISVSVGIGASSWLAKVASGVQKPDGLVEINADNFDQIYRQMKLQDLTGISRANSLRLNRVGIYSVSSFYEASLDSLRGAFSRALSRDWYLRLRGFEIDNYDLTRKSFGNSFVLPKTVYELSDILPILSKLTEKMGFRLRKSGFGASGVWLGIGTRPIQWGVKSHQFWHRRQKLNRMVFDSKDLYQEVVKLLMLSPYCDGVKSLAVSCFGLGDKEAVQLDLFCTSERNNKLVSALDKINLGWGMFTVKPARMLDTAGYVPDRIAFGGIRELEEIHMDPLAF